MIDENLISILKEIGTPVAIISATIVAVFMRKIHDKLGLAAGIITLVAVAAYIPIDLGPKARDAFAKTKIEVSPQKFHSFLLDGSPTEVSILTKRGDETVDELKVPSIGTDHLATRPISLERHPTGNSFYAVIGQTKYGIIKDETLESKGFQRYLANSNKPQHIKSSKRVYIGKTWAIHNTPLGKLELTFLKIQNGKVLLKLSSSSFGTPQPETIEIANKQFEVQCFEGKYEVTVQVREANFDTKGLEWAAFTIVIA